MDTSSFLCSLRRFLAIPGPALRMRCDRRTNFVGAKTEIDDEEDKESMANYLSEKKMWWLFKPPRASHYGGVSEGQRSTLHCILDAMLLELRVRQLTHELLVTLISEIATIVNSRPITALQSNIDQPLSGSHLGFRTSCGNVSH